MNLREKAERFATICHSGQIRKYTGEPYIEHPISVMNILLDHIPDATEEMLAAALLHDTVEDTEATLADIESFFGPRVRELVFWLTDKSKKSDGNRAARKKIDRDHIASAPPEAQTIKLADLIDNSQSIVGRDPDFAKVYMREKRLLLDELKDAATELWQTADAIVSNYERGEF